MRIRRTSNPYFQLTWKSSSGQPSQKIYDWSQEVTSVFLDNNCFQSWMLDQIYLVTARLPGQILNMNSTHFWVMTFWITYLYNNWNLSGQLGLKNTPTLSPRKNKTSCTSVLYMTWHYLMIKLLSWSTEKGVPLHCNYSQVHYDLEWVYLLGSHLWIK